jgi:osmoprotectant transport system substrate-binding protein
MTPRLFGRASALAVVLVLLAAACGGDDSGDNGSAGSTATSGSASSTGSTASAGTATFAFKPLDTGGPITKAALDKGDVDVALLFSSDADIAAKGWVSLEDDKHLQQIENLTPAIRTDKKTPAIAAALEAVSAKLTTDELIEMNRQNSVEDKSPKDVAAAWLAKNKLVPYSGDKVTGTLKVGSTNFAEQEIVAELYSQVLTAAGATVERKFQLGAREVVAPALESGDIDLYPEYLGSYLLFLQPDATVSTEAATVVDALNKALAAKKLEMLEPSEAQDTNTFVVTQDTADTYNLKTVSDLAKVTKKLTLGGPPECPERPFCLIGLKETYGLKFDM